MPTYEFYCDPDDGGCSKVIEIQCPYSEKAKTQPKSCPECKKRKSLRELFGRSETVFIPKTLGSFADKRTDKLSQDEKTHLYIRNNAYKSSKQSAWVSTPDGFKHRDNL